MKYIITSLILGISIIKAQNLPPGAHHGHAGHDEHLHKTLHPHMHLHKKNYLNAIKLDIGLSSGSYFGDLCDGMECLTLRPGLSVGLSYRYNKRFTVRGQLNYVMLAGSDKGRGNYTRNLSFLTHGIELIGGGTYDILRFEPLYFRRIDVAPYLHAGLGLLHYSPTTRYNGEWYRLRPLKTEATKYSQVAFTIPFGFGLRFKLKDHWDLSAEAGYRLLFTDYLDDVSSQYKVKPVQSQAEFDEAVANPTKANLSKLLSDRSWQINNYNYDSPKSGWYYYHYRVVGDKLTLVDPDNPSTYDNSSPDEAYHQYRRRGNAQKKDGYFVFTLSANYTIKVTKQRVVSINKVYSPRFRSRKR